MGIKSALSRPLAQFVIHQQKKWYNNPGTIQKKLLINLLRRAAGTAFGKEHGFSRINNYSEYKNAVSIRDYEDFRPYIDKIIKGESDILWTGKPLYFAKTSGTTSGIKYIPISQESISNHINGARDALLNYIADTGNASFLDKKLIFLSGSPTLEKKNGIHIGRLSGIVNHHVPSYLRKNQLPTYDVNCIEDWERKLDQIVDQTLPSPMALISGIPPWVQMYFDKITERTGKPVKDVFPEFSLFVYGGVNFAPYQKRLFDSIGKKVDSVETYPASEGFIAFQNVQEDPSLLLLLNSGIFYEFVPADRYFSSDPPRLTIEEVELNVNYALILTNNAGLWSYSIGDTIKFVSRNPYKILVTGRIKHFISAFGEHVIGEEVEKAMDITTGLFPETRITEFTVAPQVTPEAGLPYHEWLIEFGQEPHDADAFISTLNKELVRLNTYYKDLITGNILQRLKITKLQKDAFRNYMKEQGKLGGQNKVPRLSNDRTFAEGLLKFKQ